MIRKFVSVVGACILAAACAHGVAPPQSNVPKSEAKPPPRRIPFLIDKRFTKEGRDVIRRAFSVWETYSNGLIEFDLVFDYELNGDIPPTNAFVGQMSDDPMVADTMERCQCVPLGLTYQAKGYPTIIALVIDQISDTNVFYETAIHEIGHALGLHDLRDDSESVMYYAARPISAHCPNRSDMSEFCRANGCRLEDVRYCL